MQSLTRKSLPFVVITSTALTACSATPLTEPEQKIEAGRYDVIASPGTPRPPFVFSAEDNALLDEVQHACFLYFWNEGIEPTKMVPDRTSITAVSTAGVGFQLAALVVGVEHHWITRDQGRDRALHILRTLESAKDNRKEGVFFHFISGRTGGQPDDGKAYEHVVSTIDSALLFSGMLTASSYFGGEVAEIGDRLFEGANWKSFVLGDRAEKAVDKPYISLAWKPTDEKNPTGDGKLVPYTWIDSGDEHKLVTFLAVAAPSDARRVDPRLYYQLRRTVGEYPGLGGPSHMVYLPWSGAMFIDGFAHCFINYNAIGPDDPSSFNAKNRPRVDWWENSRRHVMLHRVKANEAGVAARGSGDAAHSHLGMYAWGLSAGDKKEGYQVPGVYPKLVRPSGWVAETDYATYEPKDDLGDGTLAPYGPAMALMFDRDAIETLRAMREWKNKEGRALAWKPVEDHKGDWSGHTKGFGFHSFHPGTGWTAPDQLPIENGPMLLAIENARTGLVWRTFQQHPFVRDAMKRLGMEPNRR